MPMQPRIDFVSLVVDDIPRSLAFYEGLGLAGAIRAAEDHIGITLESGGSLVLYSRSSFETQFEGMAKADGSGSVILSSYVPEKEDVEAVLATAAAHGGTRVDGPQDYEWGGHAGYFRDPDGHFWEIVWNPEISKQGETS